MEKEIDLATEILSSPDDSRRTWTLAGVSDISVAGQRDLTPYGDQVLL